MSTTVSKTTHAIFLIVILISGFIGLTHPVSSYGKIYQNAICDDINLNINGIDQKQIQRQTENNNFKTTTNDQAIPEEQALNALTDSIGNGNVEEPLLTLDRNIVNVCLNENDNFMDAEFIGTQEQEQTGPPPIEDFLDLAVANRFSGDVSILLGDGDGSFTQAANSPVPVGANPISIALGDFNEDGNLDLAVANQDSNNLSILLGDGEGTSTQAAESPITVGTSPTSVATGDFDGDGTLDLIVTNFRSNNVSFLLGDGDGTFTQAPNSPLIEGIFPTFVETGDFDDDGSLDLAITYAASNNLSILLGDGEGTFTQAAESPIPVGDRPSFVETGDFNNNGNLDLAVVSSNSDNLSILLGDGDGTFTQAPESPITVGDFPFSVATGDFDGDDTLDLAVTNGGSNNVFILLGDGDGTFTQAPESPITAGTVPAYVVTADFDGDDTLDLAITNFRSNNVSILLGDGDGTFTQAAESPVPVGAGPFSIAVGNFN